MKPSLPSPTSSAASRRVHARDLSISPFRTALIVDDDPDLRSLLASLLRRIGFSCAVAPHAAAARFLLETLRPELIITDLRMPGGDGWELLRFCRDRRLGATVLIASGETPGAEPELEQTAAGFLAKPFDASQFFSAVRAAMATRAPAEEVAA